MSLIIKNGRVIDPANDVDKIMHVVIEDDKIKQLIDVDCEDEILAAQNTAQKVIKL